MELTFTQSQQTFDGKAAYESEFQVTGDFNIHIERKEGGRFLLYQRGIGSGEYAFVDEIGNQDHKAVIDLDMSALVYPKYIKVVSESEPTLGVVTFNA